MAVLASPSEVEESRLLEEEVTERAAGDMVGALSSPKVITWEWLASEAIKDTGYKAVADMIASGDKGPWPQ